MYKNRIEGAAKLGERARNREALVTKARRRKAALINKRFNYIALPFGRIT
jgi:hypothetical protein